jgi:hypothetical protein
MCVCVCVRTRDRHRKCNVTCYPQRPFKLSNAMNRKNTILTETARTCGNLAALPAGSSTVLKSFISCQLISILRNQIVRLVALRRLVIAAQRFQEA